MSEGEWLDLMLEEIERKRGEQAEAREETQRRRSPDSPVSNSDERHGSAARTT